MAKSMTYGPIRNKKELSALLDILAPTFNFSRAQGDDYSKIVGEKNYRVIRNGSTVVGGCALLPLGQYFGGRSVPMIGVAAVAVAPEHRGRNTATTLMRSAVQEMHERGIALSALYPATLPLYRSVGYEQAGVRFEIRIPAKTLSAKFADDGMEIRAITPADEPAIRKVYHARAAKAAGNLDRSDFNWHRVKAPRGQIACGYVVINAANRRAEGYCYYLQKDNASPPDAAHAPLVMHVTDLVALPPAAGRALLGFFARHRSMIDQVFFQGNPNDPILKLLPERNYGARLLDHWMLRIVDVKAALQARGYPPLDAQLHLEVMDDLLEGNHGRFLLEIKSGKPRVSSGGRGEIRIDVRGLAALYSSHLSPHELQAIGQLTLARETRDADAALAEAQAVFAGPAPWLGDMF